MEKKYQLPSVGKLLQNAVIKEQLQNCERSGLTGIIRQEIGSLRQKLLRSELEKAPNPEDLINLILVKLKQEECVSLRPVINASGILLHTNLGRAPLGRKNSQTIGKNLLGYSNLEFDLEGGKRGSRHSHLSVKFSRLCGAEDAVVVNNNAAGVLIALSAIGSGKEVIVSRGELIEIGGSFRLPDIMESAGCVLREVGTTNKTHLSDCRKAINENTAAILKVHRSNFYINGFCKEVHLPELSDLCEVQSLPLLYDLGSGLPRKVDSAAFDGEPTVKDSLAEGADLIMFSCDKLMGGGQGGVICGKRKLVKVISSHPLMRAMRISKLDLCVIESVCSTFLVGKEKQELPLFQLISRSQEDLLKILHRLQRNIDKANIPSVICKSEGRLGGGTLPDRRVPSQSLRIDFECKTAAQIAEKSEGLYRFLLAQDKAVLGNLRAGRFYLDSLSLFEEEIETLAQSLIQAYSKI